LRGDWITNTEGAEVMCWGKLFQIIAAVTGKAVVVGINADNSSSYQLHYTTLQKETRKPS